MKGSFEAVSRRCRVETLPPDARQHARQLAMQGLYVMALACRPLNDAKGNPLRGVTSSGRLDEFMQRPRGELEKELTFLGFLTFHNDLKSDSPDAIAELHNGCVVPVMITGDDVWTGVHIAQRSGVIPPGAALLVGDLAGWEFDHARAGGGPSAVVGSGSTVVDHNGLVGGVRGSLVPSSSRTTAGGIEDQSELVWSFLDPAHTKHIPAWGQILGSRKATYTSKLVYLHSKSIEEREKPTLSIRKRFQCVKCGSKIL